ncbi:MAG: hypothetical protein ACI4SS_03245 [Clostridia bacterium]
MRKVHKTRNELVGLDEAVKLNPELKSEFAATSMKLKQQEAALKDFCKQTGIKYESPRVQVQGFGRSTSQKAVWANKRGLTNSVNDDNIKLLKERIAKCEITLTLNAEKQLPHMEKTRMEGKSYFIISMEYGNWYCKYYKSRANPRCDYSR